MLTLKELYELTKDEDYLDIVVVDNAYFKESSFAQKGAIGTISFVKSTKIESAVSSEDFFFAFTFKIQWCYKKENKEVNETQFITFYNMDGFTGLDLFNKGVINIDLVKKYLKTNKEESFLQWFTKNISKIEGKRA